MSYNVVNGVVLNDAISKELASLQGGYARLISDELADLIGFLLEYNEYFDDKIKELLDFLAILHAARTALLNLIPEEQEGGVR
ncbi:hypothetical protein [Bacteroides sp. L10-4]|uniref:hypothetical protein n=1 Tax=Bacteroides sp. L10-4 TaxID=2746063 RepID=UPI00159500B3|nr:hypothetical protein [Bacteroides sp. L10-4]NVK91924.1 hypothetical protein [Bacteroides sp. L10-4]